MEKLNAHSKTTLGERRNLYFQYEHVMRHIARSTETKPKKHYWPFFHSPIAARPCPLNILDILEVLFFVEIGK